MVEDQLVNAPVDIVLGSTQEPSNLVAGQTALITFHDQKVFPVGGMGRKPGLSFGTQLRCDLGKDHPPVGFDARAFRLFA